MSKFELLSRKVSIAGEITDSNTGKPIKDVIVVLNKYPSAFKSLLELKSKQYNKEWKNMGMRPDRTVTDSIGHFHFMDLPAGKYTIGAMAGLRTKRYSEGEIEVDVNDFSDENFKYSKADIKLQSTSVKGVITDKSTDEPVVFAEVSIKGSNETSISNIKGEYLLNALETVPNKPRGLRVTAKGYKTVSKKVSLTEPGTLKKVSFSLEPA